MKIAILSILCLVQLAATGLAVGNADAYCDRAVDLLHQEGEKGLDRALALFKEGVAKDPKSARARQGVADALILKFELAKKKDSAWLKQAIEQLDEAISLAPGQARYYFSRATAYFDLNKPKAGMKDLRKALLADPGDARTHAALIGQLVATGADERAELRAQEAMRQFKDDPEALWIVGNAFLAQGKAMEAKVFFSRARNIKPRDAAVLQRLADAQLGAGSHQQAAATYAQAVRLAPKNAQVRFGLALSLAGSGEYNDAIRAMEQFLAMVPGDPAALNNLALYCEAADKKAEAIKHWSALRQSSKAGKAHKARAEKHLKALMRSGE